MKARRKCNPFFIFLVFLIAGCQSRDEFLWEIGCYVFGIYFLLLVATILLPRIHRTQWFRTLAKRIEMPVAGLACLVILGGIGVIAFGFQNFMGASFGPGKLTSVLGVMVLIAGANLLLWARADSPEEKTLRMKIVLTSMTFGLSLLYILGGASLIG